MGGVDHVAGRSERNRERKLEREKGGRKEKGGKERRVGRQ